MLRPEVSMLQTKQFWQVLRNQRQSMATTTRLVRLAVLATFFILFASAGVRRFKVVLDGPGNGDGSEFKVTLFWLDESYSCSFTPNNAASGTVLTCNNPSATSIPEGLFTRYYAKFEYSGATKIQFRSLSVTANGGDTFEMNSFCICMFYRVCVALA